MSPTVTCKLPLTLNPSFKISAYSAFCLSVSSGTLSSCASPALSATFLFKISTVTSAPKPSARLIAAPIFTFPKSLISKVIPVASEFSPHVKFSINCLIISFKFKTPGNPFNTPAPSAFFSPLPKPSADKGSLTFIPSPALI